MTSQTRGFTLLEVLIALGILASAMTVLMGTMANSGQQAAFSNDLTVATQLARSQMIELEYDVMAEGFQNSDQQLSGDFSREGYPDITWKAEINVVEIPETSKDEFLGQINSQLFGNESQGALQGNAAFSSMLPMLIAQLPQMINNIGEKVRRVELTVEFPRGTGMFPVKSSQYIVDPELNEFNVFSPADP